MKIFFNLCGLCSDATRTVAEAEMKSEEIIETNSIVSESVEEVQPEENPFLLPPKENNLPTLVLDLDGTLVYASYNIFVGYDFEIKIDAHNKTDSIYVKIRPHLFIFLEDLSKKYEIVIFTAAKQEYAKKVVKIINKLGYVKYVLYRDSCLKIEGEYIKDLSRLGRSLDRTVIVDDIAGSYRLQPSNGIPISPYYGKEDDNCLFTMKYYLESIAEFEKIV